jgi:hypothetical protein
MARGRKTGGRRQGTPNKATIEKSLIAARTVADARAGGKKLAKEVLQEFMELFAGMAAHYQPTPTHLPLNPNENEPQFLRYAGLAVECAKAVAPFQSPTFKAIEVVPPPPPPPEPATIDGKMINIDDPVVLGNIYRRMVTTVRGK